MHRPRLVADPCDVPELDPGRAPIREMGDVAGDADALHTTSHDYRTAV